jgi:hypothetical protein
MQSVIWPTDTLRPGATGGSKPATEWLKLLVDANNSNAPAVTLRLYTPDSPDGKELAVDASGERVVVVTDACKAHAAAVVRPFTEAGGV